LTTVIVYSRKDCEACEKTIELLENLKKEFSFDLVQIDIDSNKEFSKKYGKEIPVVKIGPYTLSGLIDESKLIVTIKAAIDRDHQLVEVGDKQYQKRISSGRSFSSFDRFSLKLSKLYIWLITFFLMLYVGLPFLAPVFQNNGAVFPAKIIYTIYKPLCHQLAFRSWFIFGEQPFYPRELAGIKGILSYEDITNSSEINIRDAQNFTGNDTLGYKVALCERDIAIYASMLLFSIAFIVSGRRIKSLPWYIWIIIGLVPIAIDGISQLPGLASNLPSWFLRESTPLLRTITGTLFGFTTAWYLFPLIEESMNDTRMVLEEKKAFQEQKII
jgi:uncharacterized membrane protein/glutaredoxin